MEREKQQKDEMRRLLNKQMNEKKQREQAEKAHNDEQAMIWARDKENYEEEEARLNRKIKAINNQNSDFLKGQMAEKAGKAQMRKMNKQEYAFNKPLLKEITEKRRDDGYSHNDVASRGGQWTHGPQKSKWLVNE